ncbi:hypothetical protein SDC9_158495 [bioreactor metagenome]|uniref:Uncharacterized protein n=1 Tax=bioreactor metagenome TaxID=1076179 RepID=A0A645FFB9_9ZZZZ
MAINRLSHHPGWVSEVDHPRIRAQFFHIFNNIKDNRNGTQAFEQPASAVGFLPQIPVAQRNAFILFTGLQLPYTQLGGNEISIFQCFTAIQRFKQLHRYAGFIDHALA